MPPVPKRRHSTRRQGKRRAKINLKTPVLVPCIQCGELKPPHTACPNCGSYGKD